jgi:hypothetical protein
MTGTATE